MKKLDGVAQSATFDNGIEFMRHTKLHEHGIDTYFCDPGAPWQKGSVEHLNGMIRRFIPFRVNYEEISQDLVQEIAYRLNHMPRESLGFLTPCEAFNQEFQTVNSRCCI